MHPFGTLERELGVIEDLNIQTKAILADNNVTDTEFSEAVHSCLPSIPYQIEADTLESRREMKDVRVFTLENANAEGKNKKKTSFFFFLYYHLIYKKEINMNFIF